MDRAALPTGTVTFLFTDVEGSTRLLQEHGAMYADLLGAHRRALREAFVAHGGARALTGSGGLVARLGDVPAGRSQVEEAIDLWREPGELGEVASALHTLGWLLLYGEEDRGSLDPFSLGVSISAAFWDALLERYLDPARSQLGADAAAIWADGRALSFDEAVEFALAS